MAITDPDIEDYIQKHCSPEPEVLKELNRYTHLKVLMPKMLSGHVQGRTLSLISHMLRPSSVLEIGTYTGYSALCFAEGLKDGGRIITIDKNEELAPVVQDFIKKAGYQDKIIPKVGDAAEIIPELDQSFDLVFIDADKKNYSAYYDLVFDKVRKGGFILADNVLWSGKVVEEKSPKKNTRAILEFNDKVSTDERVEKVILPVRDGLFILRKK